MSESYAFVLAVALVALAAGGAFLVRRSLLSKAQPTQVCGIQMRVWRVCTYIDYVHTSAHRHHQWSASAMDYRAPLMFYSRVPQPSAQQHQAPASVTSQHLASSGELWYYQLLGAPHGETHLQSLRSSCCSDGSTESAD